MSQDKYRYSFATRVTAELFEKLDQIKHENRLTGMSDFARNCIELVLRDKESTDYVISLCRTLKRKTNGSQTNEE